MKAILAAVSAAALGCCFTSCADRTADAPKTVGGRVYGVASVPFRHRWWHYYERGLSWANGRFWTEAEADLRQCLAMRATDSRRARIYGLHFVQCFAHRELGAVLLEQGRLDEAERELRLSKAQEPSAKADYLLERVAQLRDKQAEAAAPATAPELVLDGPADDQIVNAKHVVYRFHARSPDGLQTLSVVDAAGKTLAEKALTGADAAGMLALSLPEGVQSIRVAVKTAGGRETACDRRLDIRREPRQDANLRAVALVLPLQSPAMSLRDDDDPRLVSALIDDGRFRFLDRQADEILNRELKLVEAGWVNRKTAARAGQRLRARYVLAGTVGRDERGLECFVRLIHAESGDVLATADAYAEARDEDQEAAFFEIVAERLRQVFPVLQGFVTATDERVYLDLGDRSNVPAHMRFNVFPAEADQTDAEQRVLMQNERNVAAIIEVERSERERSQAKLVSGHLSRSTMPAVSE